MTEANRLAMVAGMLTGSGVLKTAATSATIRPSEVTTTARMRTAS